METPWALPWSLPCRVWGRAGGGKGREVMLKRIGPRLTYANVMVTLLTFVVLGGGTAIASFVINSNADVAPNTISGHVPPAGDHSNLITGSVGSDDLAAGSVLTGKIANDAIGSQGPGQDVDERRSPGRRLPASEDAATQHRWRRLAVHDRARDAGFVLHE